MKRYALIATASVLCAFAAQAGEDVTFEAVDTNGDGFVTESEFVTHQTASGEVSSTDALIKFIAVDADASGAISPEEMDAAMAAKAEDTSADDDTMSDGT